MNSLLGPEVIFLIPFFYLVGPCGMSCLPSIARQGKLEVASDVYGFEQNGFTVLQPFGVTSLVASSLIRHECNFNSTGPEIGEVIRQQILPVLQPPLRCNLSSLTHSGEVSLTVCVFNVTWPGSADVYIVGVARTPMGSLSGSLSSLAATKLGSLAIQGKFMNLKSCSERTLPVIYTSLLPRFKSFLYMSCAEILDCFE